MRNAFERFGGDGSERAHEGGRSASRGRQDELLGLDLARLGRRRATRPVGEPRKRRCRAAGESRRRGPSPSLAAAFRGRCETRGDRARGARASSRRPSGLSRIAPRRMLPCSLSQRASEGKASATARRAGSPAKIPPTNGVTMRSATSGPRRRAKKSCTVSSSRPPPRRTARPGDAACPKRTGSRGRQQGAGRGGQRVQPAVEVDVARQLRVAQQHVGFEAELPHQAEDRGCRPDRVGAGLEEKAVAPLGPHDAARPVLALQEKRSRRPARTRFSAAVRPERPAPTTTVATFAAPSVAPETVGRAGDVRQGAQKGGPVVQPRRPEEAGDSGSPRASSPKS